MTPKVWFDTNLGKIQCPFCLSVFPGPEQESTTKVTCPICQENLYSEKEILSRLLASMHSVYKNTQIEYDETLEYTIFFLEKYNYLLERDKLLTTAFNQLNDMILGKEYRIADPVDGLTAIEIMTQDMCRQLASKPKKSIFKRRKKQRKDEQK